MGGSRVQSQPPFLRPSASLLVSVMAAMKRAAAMKAAMKKSGMKKAAMKAAMKAKKESSHEGPSHAEGHEEVQGVRVGMRAEQWGRFLKSALPTTHFGLLLWIHSAGCGQCVFSRRGLYGRSRQLECI